MERLTIESLDPPLEEELRDRAASHGLSVAEEARRILVGALLQPPVSPSKSVALNDADVRRRVAEVLANARRPDRAADWKTLSDEFWADPA